MEQLIHSGVAQHLKSEMGLAQGTVAAISTDRNQGPWRNQNFPMPHFVDKQPLESPSDDGANFCDERRGGFGDDGTTTGSDASSAKLVIQLFPMTDYCEQLF